MYKRGLAIAASLAAFAAPAFCSVANAVPKGDWSYSVIQDLSHQGMIDGYPKDADLFGNRELNRYEMAALVSRVVAKLTADESAGQTPDATTLEEVSRLVKEYGAELAVLGTDVDNLKLGLQSITDTVQDHQKAIDALNKTKVSAGTGSVTFTGDVQMWALSGNKDVTNFGGGSGTGLGQTSSSGAANTDTALSNTFKIRRVELRFNGALDNNAYWLVMIDPSRDQTLKTTSTTSQQSTSGTSALQDVYVGWHLDPAWNLEVGQQKTPTSIEGTRSSINLLTIERSLMNEVSYAQGRIGDQRDLGLWLRYNKPGVSSATFALLNDGGNRQDLVDDNNGKEAFVNYQYFVIKPLQIGAYAEDGEVGAPQTSRRHFGCDFDYNKGADELTGELAGGYDGDLKAHANTGAAAASPTARLNTQGGYLTYGRRLSTKFQAVARYDTFDPNRDMHNVERDVTLGINYFMKGNNSKIQLNYINRSITGPETNGAATAYSSLGASRYVWMTNFQQAW